MNPPTRPAEPEVSQTLKPKQITGEKTLLNKKRIKFFLGGAGPWLASNSYFEVKIYLTENLDLRLLVQSPAMQAFFTPYCKNDAVLDFT